MDVNNLPAETAEPTKTEVQHAPNTFMGNFIECYKMAAVYAKSSLVPSNYQGKQGDCAIAINMAQRMDIDPIMVMQSLYVVKGKPSWSGQACMSFIKAKYDNVFPVYTGKKGTDSRGCYIKAISKSGEILEGTEVTIEMAKAEGWLSNPKWKNMPEQMLAYRAAAFFARIYCPEVLMGVSVEGEVEDSENKIEQAPNPFGGAK